MSWEARVRPGKDALPSTLPTQIMPITTKPPKGSASGETQSRYSHLSDWDVSKGSRTFLPPYEPPPLPKRRKLVSQPISQPPVRPTAKIEPTPCSFPRRSLDNPPVGPASYSPELRRIKPTPKTAVFGKLTSRRFEDHTYPYGIATEPENHSKRRAKQNWFFSSGTSRTSAFEANSVNPGPGQYKSPTYIGTGRSIVFKNTREQPLSNDPHRPYASQLAPNPPIGAYMTDDDRFKKKTVRERLSPMRETVKSPPFGTAEERFNKFSAFGVCEEEYVHSGSPTKFQITTDSPLT